MMWTPSVGISVIILVYLVEEAFSLVFPPALPAKIAVMK